MKNFFNEQTQNISLTSFDYLSNPFYEQILKQTPLTNFDDFKEVISFLDMEHIEDTKFINLQKHLNNLSKKKEKKMILNINNLNPIYFNQNNFLFKFFSNDENQNILLKLYTYKELWIEDKGKKYENDILDSFIFNTNLEMFQTLKNNFNDFLIIDDYFFLLDYHNKYDTKLDNIKMSIYKINDNFFYYILEQQLLSFQPIYIGQYYTKINFLKITKDKIISEEYKDKENIFNQNNKKFIKIVD